jgi:hypothetical protein
MENFFHLIGRHSEWRVPMKLQGQLVGWADDGREEPVQKMATCEKDC